MYLFIESALSISLLYFLFIYIIYRIDTHNIHIYVNIFINIFSSEKFFNFIKNYLFNTYIILHFSLHSFLIECSTHPKTWPRTARPPDFCQRIETRTITVPRIRKNRTLIPLTILNSHDQLERTNEQTHPLLFSPSLSSTLYTLHDDLCPTTTNVDHLRSIWNVAFGRDTARPFRATRWEGNRKRQEIEREKESEREGGD